MRALFKGAQKWLATAGEWRSGVFIWRHVQKETEWISMWVVKWVNELVSGGGDCLFRELQKETE